MSTLFKFCTFFTSFIPLWISIIYVDTVSLINNNDFVEVEKYSIIIILTLLAITTYVVFRELKSVEHSTNDLQVYQIIKAKRMKGITSEFLLAYILPFFAFDFTVWNDIVLFLIYFLTLAFLCIRNNNVYSNILFEIKGFHYFECDLSTVSTMVPDHTFYVSKNILSKENLDSKIGHSIELYHWDSQLSFNKTTPWA